jgi:hypothetical protein
MYDLGFLKAQRRVNVLRLVQLVTVQFNVS